VLAWFGGGVLVATAIIALALVLPWWAAALIVGVVLLAAAGVLALVGKRRISRAMPPAPQQAIDSVKDDVETVKRSAHR
jgi:membrane protein implicated in regulation of membrane protease activity